MAPLLAEYPTVRDHVVLDAEVQVRHEFPYRHNQLERMLIVLIAVFAQDVIGQLDKRNRFTALVILVVAKKVIRNEDIESFAVD